MIWACGIFISAVLLTVNGFYFGQNNVFLVKDYVRHHDSSTNSNDWEIYFEAIKDTFGLYHRDSRYKNGSVCRSDQTKLDIGDKSYPSLVRNFNRSCTYVIGNVVIAYMSHEDISFLDSIKEISGYLFIYNNSVKSISLKSLEVIRGENALLLQGDKYALAVAVNVELEYLLMPNLQVILRHDILILETPGLCYMAMVNWDSLIYKAQSVRISVSNETSCLSQPDQTLLCHSSCLPWNGKQFCWSNNRFMCQKINKCRNQNCSSGTKCYKNPKNYAEECCDEQCAGGCSGYGPGRCLACKNFNNDGSCVEYCPSQILYKNNRQIKNPDGKLAFHNMCVDRCPVRFFNEYGNCVLNCTTPNTYPVNETCIKCPNNRCPKVCLMEDIMHNKDVDFVNREMLNRLENCTAYDGNIIINMFSFKGDPYYNMPKEKYGITMNDLKKMINLQEIYGHLEVNSVIFPNMTNLFFLRNLKIIRANNIVSNQKYGLRIIGNHNLTFLALKSLTEVQNGDILISNNNKLCWAHTLTNRSIRHRGLMKITQERKCERYRECDKQCDKNYGCWGLGPVLCVKCTNYIVNSVACLADCSERVGYFSGNVTFTEKKERKCQKCHSQCERKPTTCWGPNNDQCNHGCRHFTHKGHCVERCPQDSFSESKICIPCHPVCTESIGKDSLVSACKGSRDILGDRGCRKCNNILIYINQSDPFYNHLQCLSSSQSCPDGFFNFQVDFGSPVFLTKIAKHILEHRYVDNLLSNWFNNRTNRMEYGSMCIPCHPLCSTCRDGSDSQCHQCKFYKHEEQCIEQCPIDHFSPSSADTEMNTDKKCIRCHEECDGGCNGTLEFNCRKCRHVKIFTNDSTDNFYCNNTCGDLFQITHNSERICIKKRRMNEMIWWWLLMLIGIFLFTIFCCSILMIYFTVTFRNKRNYKMKQINLDQFRHPQTQVSASVLPNMATLLLLAENQLTRGEIIGSGAFGVVHKAIWQPNFDRIDNNNSFLKRYFAKYSKDYSIKLPVAVKVLSDISDATNNMQLLEEAKVMASVDHCCCLRLLGVCLTSHPQLVTQFMPLGCLLEFCQKQRNFINNARFLNWAKQISFGMEYLESKGIIHCDLAARNVLVQSPQQVKITDFGLAKMLDHSQQHYQSKGGRMPIKWLAIECIKHRLFSSKSDVWSFGVTLWEMFTFGEKPFQKIKAFEILNHLEKGQRLPQPKICSVDLYSIMIECWLVDPESRRSFSELSKTFEKMAENPNRYLLIQNSPELGSIYCGLENDALRYDEFLQALTSVPQINLQYDSLDQSIYDKRKIKTVKNHYREMCSYNNSFVTYINGWKDSDNNSVAVTESKEMYEQSNWSEYSRECKGMSNSTLFTTLNTSMDYTTLTPMNPANLSEDGYLIPNPNLILKSNTQSLNFRLTPLHTPQLGSTSREIPEKEVLIGNQDYL